MKHLLIILSFLLLSSPVIGQSERPETIIIPVSSLGNVHEVRKQILQNTLTDELKKYFRIVPQEKYEQVLEQVFEELEYEECSEDTCIMMVQEMLQVENVFNLQVLGEDKDTQLNLTWRTLDEKRNEEDYCEGCGTFQLNDKVMGLVEKLVGEKEIEPVVVERPVVVETPKVVQKVVKEPVVQRTEGDKTKVMFVTVGSSGTILTSSDGTSWTKRTSGTSEYLLEVTYGNGLFVTVGWGTILTSSDGTTWTERTSGTSEYLRGVTFGNGLFVTVSLGGTILTSPDGNSWTIRTSGTYYSLYDVTYGNNKFVTVGWGTILTSSDGTSWDNRTSGTSIILEGVTYSQ